MFGLQEALCLALRIETNSYYYYSTLEKSINSSELSTTLRFLTSQELKHKKSLEEMLKRVEKLKIAESCSEEYELYLKALASKHIFTNREKTESFFSHVSSKEDIFLPALGFEQDAILFFTKMKKFLPQERKILGELIEEEKEHLKRIASLLSL